jgi:putative transposase
METALIKPLSFKRHRYPGEVIRYAVWLYFRFTLSLRDVEELLAQRGIEASREAIRCWVNKFGPQIAANIRRRRDQPTGRWHLDEVVVKIKGRRMWLWRAVDDEGEVLDVLVQRRRNTAAAYKLMRRLLKHNGLHPETITTDKLASYRSALRKLGILKVHRPGGMRENNRAENSHSPTRRREREQQRFKSQGSAQRFLSAHGPIYNLLASPPFGSTSSNTSSAAEPFAPSEAEPSKNGAS